MRAGLFFRLRFQVVINSIYGSISIFTYAVRRICLRAGRALPDDARVLAGGSAAGAVKARYASRASGTKRTQAGSIGGQLAVASVNVPAFLAAAIFSGTRQRDT